MSDLRRDMNPVLRLIMTIMTKPKAIRPGLKSSLAAAYMKEELQADCSRAEAVKKGGTKLLNRSR